MLLKAKPHICSALEKPRLFAPQPHNSLWVLWKIMSFIKTHKHLSETIIRKTFSIYLFRQMRATCIISNKPTWCLSPHTSLVPRSGGLHSVFSLIRCPFFCNFCITPFHYNPMPALNTALPFPNLELRNLVPPLLCPLLQCPPLMYSSKPSFSSPIRGPHSREVGSSVPLPFLYHWHYCEQSCLFTQQITCCKGFQSIMPRII